MQIFSSWQAVRSGRGVTVHCKDGDGKQVRLYQIDAVGVHPDHPGKVVAWQGSQVLAELIS